MKKRILIFVICLALMVPVISAMAGESLLSPGGSSVKAGDSLGFKVNLGAIPDEYGAYSLTIKINPSPEKVSVSENVHVTESGGKYTISSADLSSVTALNFTIYPGSNITSDTAYSVAAMVVGENGKMSDQFNFIAKAAEQPTDPTESTDPTIPTDPTDTTDPTAPTGQTKPNGGFSGKGGGSFSGGGSGGSVDSSLVYKGSADNYLEKLSVSGYEFTRDFNKTRNTYFVTVKDGVTSLKVSATPSDSSADVSITGNNDLDTAMSKIQINVTADNGDVRVYRIYVSHESDETDEAEE